MKDFDRLDIAEVYLRQTIELYADHLHSIVATVLEKTITNEHTRADLITAQARTVKAMARKMMSARRNVMKERRAKFRAEQGMSARAKVDPTLLVLRFGPNLI